MSISLTENAAKQIKKQLQKRGRGVGLKLGLKKSGCSGFSYTLNYSDEITNEEAVFEEHDVKVIVNKDDLVVIDGLRLDYRREGINEAFRFDNPNVTGSCGCGESFTVN